MGYRNLSRAGLVSDRALLFAVGLLAASAAFAQQKSAAPAVTLEEIVVTGSSIKGIDVETALPVSVMSSVEIEQSGVVNLEQLVNKISSVSSLGAVRGSDLAGVETYGISSVSLRGLGSARTLVLVNGHRVAPFAGPALGGGGVDINSIPLSAISRVEVLRDGASSVYGSDAVAGVINFILKSDFTGAQFGVDLGKPTQSGGGNANRYELMLGMGEPGDKYNVMFAGSMQFESSLFAKARPYSSTGNLFPYFTNAATPSGRIEGIWIPGGTYPGTNSRSATNPNGITTSGYGNPAAAGTAGLSCSTINMFLVAKPGGAFNDAPNCNFDSAPFVSLFPKTERDNAYVSGKVELSDSMRLHGEASYSRTVVQEAIQPAPDRIAFMEGDTAFAGSGVDPALIIYPSNPAYTSIVVPYLTSKGANYAPMIGQPLAVTVRSFLIGPRTEHDTNTQYRALVGLEGTALKWDYNANVSYSQSKVEGSLIDGFFSLLGLAKVLNNPANNWNPWAAGGVQPAAITSQLQGTKYIGPTITGTSDLTSFDASASRGIGQLSGGAAQVAVGVNVRRESYKTAVPPILGSGDIAGLGGATPPVDASRNASAVFTEFNLPVLEQLTMNLSGRFDHYGDVGNTTNGKASVRWQPIKQVLLRGAYGTGFRAPSLIDLHRPQTLGTSEQFVDPAFPQQGLIQANAEVGGNPNLKPEKSKQYSFGVVLSPTSQVQLTVDYFHIAIDKYITNPSALALVVATRAGTPLYGPNDVIFAPDGTVDTVNQTLRNAASATVQGVDAGLSWKDTFPFGKLAFDINGTYMEKYDLRTLADVQGNIGTIVKPNGVPLDLAVFTTGVVNRWKHSASGNWSTGDWSTTASWDFYTGYRDANDLNGNPHFVPSQSIFGANVAYTGIKGANIAIGATNLFNTQPPLFIGNGVQFQYGYDIAMYDPHGRFVYLRASYKFL
jgi:iron complex outermembrane recepter protein